MHLSFLLVFILIWRFIWYILVLVFTYFQLEILVFPPNLILESCRGNIANNSLFFSPKASISFQLLIVFFLWNWNEIIFGWFLGYQIWWILIKKNVKEIHKNRMILLLFLSVGMWGENTIILNNIINHIIFYLIFMRMVVTIIMVSTIGLKKWNTEYSVTIHPKTKFLLR